MAERKWDNVTYTRKRAGNVLFVLFVTYLLIMICQMNTLKPKIFALLFFIPLLSLSQNTLEPYIGFGVDINSKKPLLQLTPGLQYPVISKRTYQMVIGVRGGLPLNKNTGTEVAYTVDPSLPLSITTEYETKFYSVAAILSNRFRISWADNNIFFLFVNVGLVSHSIRVRHDTYDMERYTILNPHKTLKKEGAFLGGGIQYKRKVGGGYWFFLVDISSPPIVKRNMNYAYENPALLAMNAGYIIEFKKRRK
jgi:hypothetical protein